MVTENDGKLTSLIVLSIIGLINVMFVPIYEVWGGFMPKSVDHDFLEVLEMILDGDTGFWVVKFTIAIFFPTVAMLIFTIIKSKIGVIISDVVGVFWVLNLLVKNMDQCGESNVFGNDCSVSIGVWIALLIFTISFIVAVRVKKSSYVDSGNHQASSACQPISPVETSKTLPIAETATQQKLCPNCKNKIDNTMIFCTGCGFRLRIGDK